MTRPEFLDYLDTTYSPTELVFIQSNIYLNPDHVGYWQMYKMGQYDECVTYLSEHTHLLNIENTPDKFKDVIDAQIEASKHRAENPEEYVEVNMETGKVTRRGTNMTPKKKKRKKRKR